MLLTLVAESLAQSPQLHVVHAAEWPEVEAHAAGCTPDVVIYDLEAGSNWHILPFLYQNPGTLLIGLDAETNRAVLVSGQETQSLTLEWMKELVEAGLR